MHVIPGTSHCKRIYTSYFNQLIPAGQCPENVGAIIAKNWPSGVAIVRASNASARSGILHTIQNSHPSFVHPTPYIRYSRKLERPSPLKNSSHLSVKKNMTSPSAMVTSSASASSLETCYTTWVSRYNYPCANRSPQLKQ